ncbi:amidohydrolase [Psychrobacillus lasiicapitis]|uniref:Amidohydrolase family protein n=1 Tax=Psychrobacillus lasiicapitis TaxID=1636719 RepID=A0A544TBZ5_9BACI|nr:amidohydrolase [Psychrobacillus lasiicapitis]TQR14993.1 amidohydrolase family protein [Psychrobacillus lasiicapitis]GGA21614.1 deaminase [Psychrobacillus lasiicapitis]
MNNYWITNVRIEKGYEKPENTVAKTLTELVNIQIEKGRIANVTTEAPPSESEMIDANGALMIPAFREMHIHIDKTYYGGPWKAVRPATNGIFTRIEEEQKVLKDQLPTVEERAKKMLELLIQNGHTHIRTHCNIDPVVGIENLKATVSALKAYEDLITYEIVAFPQHGLLRSDSVELVRQAMANGATHVGGVDPATVDRNIEKSLETVFSIAQEFDAPIDIHLHDSDSLGAFQMEQIAELTEASGNQGKVTISHALALGDLVEPRLQTVTEKLAEVGIDVTTTVPVNRPTIPIPYLWENNVPVSVGHDSITDHWSPFGTGDSIQKLALLGERFRISDEIGLSQLLRFATGGVTPLSPTGDLQWPKVGDDASFLLVDATCSAEAIARRKPIRAVYGKGNIFVPKQVVEEGVHS